jgi:hypothetical protein
VLCAPLKKLSLLHAQNIPELKELCTHFQLPKGGRKPDLIDRLVAHRVNGDLDGGRGDGAGARDADGGGGGGGIAEGSRLPAYSRARQICEHGRRLYKCTECIGGGVCQHMRLQYSCKECGGHGICEHGRVRSYCKVGPPVSALLRLLSARLPRVVAFN